ncbi:MAG: class I SAM-dependent methyltransferase [Candidatus Binataceae bacterium]
MAEPHESRVYSDFARFYDPVFGRVFVDHERDVIDSLNLRPGQRVLEVGVGTGISLDSYPAYVHVVGIDPSAGMLAQAVAKAYENQLSQIELREGDALNLDFPDSSFDWVTTFHVMTVVPDPKRMMSEMVRVCKPGGRIAIVSHFASESPLLYFAAAIINPVTKRLGWTTRLRASDVLRGHDITVERDERLSRISVHKVMVARKNG